MYLCVYVFRHNKNRDKAKEVSGKLKDNRELQHFLQNTQDVSNALLKNFICKISQIFF